METDSKKHPCVLFTHFGSLKHVEVQENRNNPDFQERYASFFRAVCGCNDRNYKRIGLVYVYLDEAVRAMAARGWPEAIPHAILHPEIVLKDFLENIWREVTGQYPRVSLPTLKVVGLSELYELILKLKEINPYLPRYLCGEDGNVFTYDSPKFTEAIIRIARGITPQFSDAPVLRIDEDVQCNSGAIETVISEYLRMREENLFFFFSGSYGTSGSTSIDYLNDFAVRTHWLNGAQAEIFLADLSELGATQFIPSVSGYSTELREILAGAPVIARTQPQCISGALLTMSTRAIATLPPFMNIGALTTWIDDSLKRRLHEVIGDITPHQLESVNNSRLKQNRHPNGVIANADITWASKHYLPRLLRGCMWHAIIAESDYADTIRNLVFDLQRDLPSTVGLFEKSLRTCASERMKKTLRCWSSVEFHRTASYEWASTLLKMPALQEEHVGNLVNDAFAYLNLVRDWPFFVRAVLRLPYYGDRWLFLPV